MTEHIQNYVKQHEPFICILVPCYSGSCCIGFIDSLIKTVDLCKTNRIRCKYLFMKDDNLIHHVRNNLVAKALSVDGVTHIMFIDEQVVWNPYDILKLLLSDKYIVGGACPKKHINWENLTNNPKCISVFNEKNKTHFSNDIFIQHKLSDYNIEIKDNTQISINNNLTMVDKMSFDFVMIKRAVFEKMFCAFPNTKYIDEGNFLVDTENNYAYTLFNIGKEKNNILSECDVFCKRWKNMGGSFWVNVTLNLTVSSRYDYKGAFYNSLI